MKHCYLILLLYTVLTACNEKSNKTGSIGPITSSSTSEKIDQYFTALSQIGKFNGVIYVSENGQTTIHKAYNINPNTESTIYVTADSQFDIHSVSKLMANYLILKYEAEGRIKRTQSIKDFIPDFPDGDKITIAMLLHHTSGMPRNLNDVDGDEINLTSDQIINYAKKQKLIFKPGTDSQYSNVGYQIIYYIISVINKKPFAQALSDDLFEPLAMKNSGAHFYTDRSNRKNLAKNHGKEDGNIVQIDNVLKDELKTARIFSTAKDLNTFLNHIKKEAYALQLKTKDNVIEKDGGSDGVRAQIYSNLEHNYNFILLTNYEEIPFQQTITDFISILEGTPYNMPKLLNREKIELPIKTLNKFVGVYSFSDMNDLELTISIEKGNLVVIQDGEQIAVLKAESEFIFFDDPKEPESFEFINNVNGHYDVFMGWKGVKLKGIKK